VETSRAVGAKNECPACTCQTAQAVNPGQFEVCFPLVRREKLKNCSAKNKAYRAGSDDGKGKA
jgi:hypothetical protein